MCTSYKKIFIFFLFSRKICIFAPYKLSITLNALAIHHKWTDNGNPLFPAGNRLCAGIQHHANLPYSCGGHLCLCGLYVLVFRGPGRSTSHPGSNYCYYSGDAAKPAKRSHRLSPSQKPKSLA